MQSKITAQQARSLQRNVRRARAEQRRRMQAAQHPQARANELEAPTVVGVLYEDNLVPLDVLDSGLEIQVPVWPRLQAGDELSILWDDVEVHRFVVTDAEMVFPYSYILPPDNMQVSGSHRLTYSALLISGLEPSSVPVIVTVDRNEPNSGNIPAALEFPAEIVSDGITPAYLAANGDKVMVKVPHYSGMEANQSVHVLWGNSHPLPIKVLEQADVDQGYVEIEIPGDTIRAAGEGRMDAYYYLTSRAGFDGKESIHSDIDVILSAPPSGLLAPTVLLAEDGLVDRDDATAGVFITVAPYQNMGAGDQVAAKWGSTALALYPMQVDGHPVDIAVSRAIVINEGSGVIDVSYEILRNSRPYGSPVTPITVDIDTAGPLDPDPTTPENELLAAPTVLGNVSQSPNELTPEDLESGATVEVPFYSEAKEGEIITVQWGSMSGLIALPPYTITAQDVTDQQLPPVPVSTAVLEGTLNNPALPVNYTLTRPLGAPAANPVLSLTQSVNAHMSGPGGIDGLGAATFDDINGRGYLLYAVVYPDGAKITVPAYLNMQANDKVTLEWQAYSALGTPVGEEIAEALFTQTIDVTADMVGSDLAFTVPYDTYISPIALEEDFFGSAKVIYTVNQGGTDFLSEEEATVNIDLLDL
ncbi:hypothetical protein [Pseudomonas knackmussii]|uniref:hypothetical protein n=1 Tax=Pseudomonas knackmussii TaxID=65741 RepID=UPI001363FE1D|nr:hypothetical protein [Pseudomonas knackmussii]